MQPPQFFLFVQMWTRVGGNGRGIKRGGEKGKAQLRVKNGTTGIILRVIYGSIPHPTSGCQPQK